MLINRISSLLRRGAVIAVAAVSLTSVQAVSAAGTDKEGHYFPYPVPPENMETLTERTNFLLEHFWERCNFKSAFSSKQRMREAFNDYVTFMPYADAAVVHASIDNLIKQVQKNSQNLLTLAEMAEGALYSDTAMVICDECYLPFAKAVAENKKIPAADKARFAYQAGSLQGSQVGMEAPDFTFTTPAGEQKTLAEVSKGAYVVLFFNDPECGDCELARVRLAADMNLNDLIEAGQIRVVSILPSEPSDEWIEKAATYNGNWIVGAAPNVDEIYDMRVSPVIYYLDGKRQILSKSLDTDGLKEGFRVVNEKLKSRRK